MKGVVVVVRSVGGDEGGVMEVVVDVEYGGVVVKWVWEVVIVAGVSYGVSPDAAAHAHRGCYVCVILCERVCGWGCAVRIACYNL